jgi:spermidine/putrescine ABC transporter ATP-binding subunit
MGSQPDFIDIQGVAKRFGSVTAVDSIDLAIGQGEFFSLLGPSGCGKTTLLRMLGGLEEPTGGRILIDREDVTRSPPYRRPTNMVFQSYAIFPHLNVAQNIGYGLRRFGLSAADKQRRVGEMLELIGLPGYAQRPATQLSGGQMQRVALARALVLKPKVLLLDEPLAALDKKLREKMQFELRTLQREIGITFIFVTHDQEEALTLSDRIAVMSGGKVLQSSTPAELYERPASRDVAEFIGEMNFFPAVVTRADADMISVDLGPIGVAELQHRSGYFRIDDKVIVALRPERIQICAAGEDLAGRGIECQIRSQAYFGNRTQFLVEVAGLHDMVAVAVPNNQKRTVAVQPERGRTRLSLDLTAAVLLPA